MPRQKTLDIHADELTVDQKTQLEATAQSLLTAKVITAAQAAQLTTTPSSSNATATPTYDMFLFGFDDSHTSDDEPDDDDPEPEDDYDPENDEPAPPLQSELDSDYVLRSAVERAKASHAYNQPTPVPRMGRLSHGGMIREIYLLEEGNYKPLSKGQLKTRLARVNDPAWQLTELTFIHEDLKGLALAGLMLVRDAYQAMADGAPSQLFAHGQPCIRLKSTHWIYPTMPNLSTKEIGVQYLNGTLRPYIPPNLWFSPAELNHTLNSGCEYDHSDSSCTACRAWWNGITKGKLRYREVASQTRSGWPVSYDMVTKSYVPGHCFNWRCNQTTDEHTYDEKDGCAVHLGPGATTCPHCQKVYTPNRDMVRCALCRQPQHCIDGEVCNACLEVHGAGILATAPPDTRFTCVSCGEVADPDGSQHTCDLCMKQPLVTESVDDTPRYQGVICAHCAVTKRRCRNHQRNEVERSVKMNNLTISADSIIDGHAERHAFFLELGCDPDKSVGHAHGGMRGYWKVAQAWGIDVPAAQPPTEGFADFYLLHATAAKVFTPNERSEMIQMLADHAGRLAKINLMYWDSQLLRYYDMILGGELRHHRALKRIFTAEGETSRAGGWLLWKRIRRDHGVAALEFAEHWFLEHAKHNGAGGYLGERWADIAVLVRQRVTNQISPHVFVDQGWSMMHNGGQAMNKLHWREGYLGRQHEAEIIQRILGPAQAANPTGWATLCRYASAPAREIFKEYRDEANRHRRALKQEPIRFEVPSSLNETPEPFHSSDFYLKELA